MVYVYFVIIKFLIIITKRNSKVIRAASKTSFKFLVNGKNSDQLQK